MTLRHADTQIIPGRKTVLGFRQLVLRGLEKKFERFGFFLRDEREESVRNA